MIKKEESPWSEAVVMVCTKCHKAISPQLLTEEGNAGEGLKNFLKRSLRESGHGPKVRVVTSSCLDVCIDDLQAISIAKIDGGTECFTLHPEKDREQILKVLQNL